jgi:type I restriction enzyme, S subunit
MTDQINQFNKTKLVQTRFKHLIELIPEEWEICTDSDITETVQSGLSRLLSPDDIGYIMLTSENIQNGKLDTSSKKYWHSIDNQGVDLNKYILKDGDILLNFINSSAQIGKACMFCKQDRDWIYTTNVFRIRVKITKIIPEFFLYFIGLKFFQKQILAITQPAINQASFSKTDLLKIVVFKPELKEQRKIVNILSNMDDLLQKTDQVIEQTQKLKKELINHLIVSDYDILGSIEKNLPNNKKYIQLSSVTEINPKHTLKKDIEYPFVEMAAINERTKSIKYFGKRVTCSDYAIFKNDDVIFARITPCTANGKICLVSSLKEYGIGSTEFIILRSKDPGVVLPHFLYYYCQTDKVRNYAISQMRGATGRQRVPDNVFKNELYIVLPDLNNQQKIVRTISNLEQLINFYELERKNEDTLKKGLMQQLLTGKTRVK